MGSNLELELSMCDGRNLPSFDLSACYKIHYIRNFFLFPYHFLYLCSVILVSVPELLLNYHVEIRANL